MFEVKNGVRSNISYRNSDWVHIGKETSVENFFCALSAMQSEDYEGESGYGSYTTFLI